MFTAPQEAEQAFYDALSQADLTLMMSVWADDEDIVCIHPGGMRTVGHGATQVTWQHIFAAGPLHIKPLRPMIITSVMTSVHVLLEHIQISTTQDKRSTHCYVTNIFQKDTKGWKMILHHASHAPGEAGLFDLQDLPDILH